ncbi:MAG: tetratricopeptide repeat protein [Planctomycetes bacterium]|nr:tetratricopeptide repeat protein [Planctomycetota bacterium]
MLRCSWIALALLGALGCGAGSAKDGAQAPPRSSRPLAPELREVGRAVEEQRFEDGRALAQRYVAAHPQDGQGHYIQGMTYYWTGNFGAARAGLERALELEPGITIAHESLGYCLFMLGDLGGARREYEAYLASAPREPKGHYGLGLVELEEARLTEAEACFRRAIELFDALERRALAARQPELAECHARLGEVHFARDELEAARAEFELATRICPGNISAFYTLSLVYRRLGEAQLADQAAATYESARQALVAGQKAKGE